MRNSDKVLSIKNDSKISYTAKEIANEFLHRGSATREKIESTLRILKDEFGIKTLKNLAQEHIDKFVSNLKYKIESGNMSLSNANSYISSINNLVKYIGKDGKEELRAIKAKDYGLSRKFNDGINKENSREFAQAFNNWLSEKYQETKNIKYEALRQAVNIQSVNLRLRESLQIKLPNKDLSQNILKISAKGDGSKNSRAREIKLTAEQKAVLIETRIFMKENNLKNLNIGTIRQGRDFANNTLKTFRSETNIYFHFHGERHWSAHEAYKQAWSEKGYDVECRARLNYHNKKEWESAMREITGLSKAEFQNIDKGIRYSISQSLGHERISITSRYLG